MVIDAAAWTVAFVLSCTGLVGLVVLVVLLQMGQPGNRVAPLGWAVLACGALSIGIRAVFLL